MKSEIVKKIKQKGGWEIYLIRVTWIPSGDKEFFITKNENKLHVISFFPTWPLIWFPTNKLKDSLKDILKIK